MHHSYYNPTFGKWLSRDPIAEDGGVHIYGFVKNDGINRFDSLGLFVELWYGNHGVAGSPVIHSKLWLITDDFDFVTESGLYFNRATDKTHIVPKSLVGPCQLAALTIGAGPDKSPDELTARFNRPSDVSEELQHPSLVASFASSAAASTFLWRVALRNETMNANFDNTTLEYELLPGDSYTKWSEWDEFNSNSYISGLLRVSGYTPPHPGGYAPGYNKPVPDFVFTSVFSSTDDLKQVWRKHFPGF